MRQRLLSSRDHAEARALAVRLERSDAGSAAADRLALLLYWYGTGATHLRAEEQVLLAAWRDGDADHPVNAAIRAERARLAADVAAVSADAHPSPDQLGAIGRALAAYVRRLDREPSAHEPAP